MQNSAQRALSMLGLRAPTATCSSFPQTPGMKALPKWTSLSLLFCLSCHGCPDWRVEKRQGIASQNFGSMASMTECPSALSAT